jgi:hypothetical protein
VDTNEWDGCHPPVEDSVFEEAQRRCGVVFPDDYKEVARLCHGGRPRKNAFAFDDPEVGRMESCVGILLSFSEDDPESIVAAYERMRSLLPAGAIPIADDGGGDFVCLDYSRRTLPTIGYWHHGAGSLVSLAPNFRAFLEMLYGESPEFQPGR